QVSSEISSDIHAVHNVAETMSQKSGQMNLSAQDLSELSLKLRDMISVFKVSTDHLDKKEDNDNNEKNYKDDLKKQTENERTSDLTKSSATAKASETVKSSKASETVKSSKTSETVKSSVKKSPEIKKSFDLITWSPKFATGIKDIDTQHKELIRMINELHNVMKQKAGIQRSGDILDGLAKYTVYHFAHEEKLFQKHDYPEYKEHKKIHEKLVGTVLAFQKDFKEGKASLSIDLMNFLTQWLKDHIMKCDMKYAPFFKDKGL
ncbi:MAG: bacteriohemerythrin, partial [Desulfamplus sp.]|nr:bacteriohemerythrin [Desulfamplus sp.]